MKLSLEQLLHIQSLLKGMTPPPWTVDYISGFYNQYITGHITSKKHTYTGNKKTDPRSVLSPDTMIWADAEGITQLYNHAEDILNELIELRKHKELKKKSKLGLKSVKSNKRQNK